MLSVTCGSCGRELSGADADSLGDWVRTHFKERCPADPPKTDNLSLAEVDRQIRDGTFGMR